MHHQPMTEIEQIAQHHIQQRLALSAQQRLCGDRLTLRCRTARTLRRLASAFDSDDG